MQRVVDAGKLCRNPELVEYIAIADCARKEAMPQSLTRGPSAEACVSGVAFLTSSRSRELEACAERTLLSLYILALPLMSYGL